MKRKEKSKKKYQQPSLEEDRPNKKKVKSSKPKYRHQKKWLDEMDDYETQTNY